MPACGQDARQDAVKLFDRQVLADIAVGAGAQRGMHPLLVVSNAGENNDRQVPIHLPDEGDQRDAIDFWHVEIDHHDITVAALKPRGRLKAFGKVFAGVAFLFEIGHEKFCDCGVIIDEEEFNGIRC